MPSAGLSPVLRAKRKDEANHPPNRWGESRAHGVRAQTHRHGGAGRLGLGPAPGRNPGEPHRYERGGPGSGRSGLNTAPTPARAGRPRAIGRRDLSEEEWKALFAEAFGPDAVAPPGWAACW